MFSWLRFSQPVQDHKRSKAAVLEEKIIQTSGLQVNRDIHIFDVPIDFQGQNYIHTYRCGDKNKEDLVLIHGFGGCSLLYFQMLKDLAHKYRVFCIDLLGMGLSSRPAFKCTSTEETIAFFVESIEKWREVMNLEKFILAGHSFGGYMSVQYAVKYQNRIAKLFLLSPAGVTKNPDPIKKAKSKPGFIRRQITKQVKSLWANKTTPTEYFREHPIIGKYLLRYYLKKQYKDTPTDANVIELIHKFYVQILNKENCSDKALHYILKPPRAQAIQPLEDILANDIKVSVICIYGDRDWVDQAGAERIESSNGEKFKLKKLMKSGHMMNMQNPVELAKYLIES